MHLIHRRAFGTVDLRPVVTETLPSVSLGERRPLPDTYGPAFELAEDCCPVIDVRSGARAAVFRPIAQREPRQCAADSLERPQKIHTEVDAVNCHVVEVAGARGLLVLPPSPAGLRQVQKALAAKVTRCSQRTGFHEMPEVPHRRRKTIRESSHVHNSGIPGSPVHLLSLGRAQTERLFTQDVLARSSRSDCQIAMREVRRPNHDGIDVGCGQ